VTGPVLPRRSAARRRARREETRRADRRDAFRDRDDTHWRGNPDTTLGADGRLSSRFVPLAEGEVAQ
jgi:hypothetical protein